MDDADSVASRVWWNALRRARAEYIFNTTCYDDRLSVDAPHILVRTEVLPSW